MRPRENWRGLIPQTLNIWPATSLIKKFENLNTRHTARFDEDSRATLAPKFPEMLRARIFSAKRQVKISVRDAMLDLKRIVEVVTACIAASSCTAPLLTTRKDLFGLSTGVS